jgi:hypothetical protein
MLQNMSQVVSVRVQMLAKNANVNAIYLIYRPKAIFDLLCIFSLQVHIYCMFFVVDIVCFFVVIV